MGFLRYACGVQALRTVDHRLRRWMTTADRNRLSPLASLFPPEQINFPLIPFRRQPGRIAETIIVRDMRFQVLPVCFNFCDRRARMLNVWGVDRVECQAVNKVGRSCAAAEQPTEIFSVKSTLEG